MTENFYNIILDGNIVKGNPGETILELSRRYGVEIPTLCNDDRIEPFSSCYVCVVEIEGIRGHQPACSTRITDGMKITTLNEGIRKSRKAALELLLSNHYADCLGPCKQTCPAGVDVQGYISLIEKGLYHDAVALIKETNPLPAICGRVCVRPCENECRRNLMEEGAPVGIDYLKRFTSDIDLMSENKFVPERKPSTGKKVAIIGAGPGGLSAAYFLQVMGHQADIFEAAEKSGGWLRYGIPEYRLPNDIVDREVQNIQDLGVNISYNKKLGGNLSYKDLKDNYDATVLTIGSQKGTGIGCDGDDAENVFSGIDFLKNMEATGQRYDFSGKTIAVIGGGNTAMDCCRTSLRCNAKKVYVIYRRTEKEMPANPIEIHESKLEGVEYMFLTLPKQVNKNDDGTLKSITCIKMELGEPDASGRRRPVPVEGSDFTVDVDYALAAIGQKTDVNFIDDINTFVEHGKLLINKWGDIDAEKKTLQTGIPSVFAAGDGVTGPATIIEAIAQAKIAAHSVNQFLMGLPVEPVNKPFTSKKENFKKQIPEDYKDQFARQKRHEMPTLPPRDRNNFHEVELGYENETVALQESQRCLECGCVAFFNCDLQRYATEYGANQKTYFGEFKEYAVDFRHPFIEIDNNKCILCGRCIRICREEVGACALGFVNRGFDTYVSPSLGDSLIETTCESCGMCISSCPTGAISENVLFKPGPVKTTSAETICNFCSVGCTISLNHKNGFVMNVTGGSGLINSNGNICRYPRFSYPYLNDKSRILKPLRKVNGKFQEISFEDAYALIKEKIGSVSPDENAFFAGARLSNEELYLIQKLARAATHTNNIGSFHYLGRGEGYRTTAGFTVPFKNIRDASKIFFIGTEINQDHAVVGYIAQNAKFRRKIPFALVTEKSHSTMMHKVDETLKVKSYYFFIKAVNHYILSNGLENSLFLRDRVTGFEEYKSGLLLEKFDTLVKKAGIKDKTLIGQFAEEYNQQINAIILYSEKEISSATATELFNLALITGKLGKTSNGMVSLREKNNSQGLWDMGIQPDRGPGSRQINDPDLVELLRKSWGIPDIPQQVNDLHGLLKKKKIKNIFIFGEDPVGCEEDEGTTKWLRDVEFRVVQDYFMTPTAAEADLILPASLPAETGGSFTNSQKVIQEFEAVLNPRIRHNNIEQIISILHLFGFNSLTDSKSVISEIISLLPLAHEHSQLKLIGTMKDDFNRIFNYGCDSVTKRFEEDFEGAFALTEIEIQDEIQEIFNE